MMIKLEVFLICLGGGLADNFPHQEDGILWVIDRPSLSTDAHGSVLIIPMF